MPEGLVKNRPFPSVPFDQCRVPEHGQCHHVDLASSLGREPPSPCLNGRLSTSPALTAWYMWALLVIAGPQWGLYETDGLELHWFYQGFRGVRGVRG